MDIEGKIRSVMQDKIQKIINDKAEAVTKYTQDEMVKEMDKWVLEKYGDALNSIKAVAHYDGGESGSITIDMSGLPDFLKKEMSEFYIDNAKRRAMG